MWSLTIQLPSPRFIRMVVRTAFPRGAQEDKLQYVTNFQVSGCAMFTNCFMDQNKSHGQTLNHSERGLPKGVDTRGEIIVTISEDDPTD